MQTLTVSKPKQESTLSSRAFADLLVEWAAEKKAENIQLFHVAEQCSYADYVLICSGTSDRHVSTIAEHIRTMGKKHGEMPLGVEGLNKGQWVLLDYANAVVHIFYEPVREYYDLERMWGKEARVELPAEINS